MLYTQDFTMRHYVGFSQIRSHIALVASYKVYGTRYFHKMCRKPWDLRCYASHLFGIPVISLSCVELLRVFFAILCGKVIVS